MIGSMERVESQVQIIANRLFGATSVTSSVCNAGVKSDGALALADLAEGLARWRLWGLLAWQDIKQRYRRSSLGPFWLTISMGVMIGTLGVLYGKLFKMEIQEYLPFLCLGFLTWIFISTSITEGCTVFITSESIIKQIKLPLSSHVYRLVWRNLIILGHNFVVFVVVALVFRVWPGQSGLLVIPGLLVIALNVTWIALLLGIISSRFRDVPLIVASLVQVVFFLTPILWKPSLLGRRVGFVDMNPFYHLIEIVRMPLLGHSPTFLSWIAALVIAAIGWSTTFLLFSRFRKRIAYWL
jgi:ABC-type polysaccharide/polyol phosphate export permease